MVVLAKRPTAERSIKDAVLATMNAIAAARVRARGRSSGSADWVASTWPQRAQRAFAPGASSGICCSRSQSGQATLSKFWRPIAIMSSPLRQRALAEDDQREPFRVSDHPTKLMDPSRAGNIAERQYATDYHRD